MSDEEPTDDPVAGDRQQPVLRVVRGEASPEEVAALVTVLASLDGGVPAPPRPTSEWSAHRRKVRAPHAHGPGGWRSSGLPR